MQTPNKYGVYEPENTEEIARAGSASAFIRPCQCEDGLFRYSIEIEYGIGGMSGPISKYAPGYKALDAARTAGVMELMRRCPPCQHSHSGKVNHDLSQLAAQLKARLAQPSLFDLIA